LPICSQAHAQKKSAYLAYDHPSPGSLDIEYSQRLIKANWYWTSSEIKAAASASVDGAKTTADQLHIPERTTLATLARINVSMAHIRGVVGSTPTADTNLRIASKRELN
jgi:hypothetical protein